VWTTQHPDWYQRNAQGALEAYHYRDLSSGKEEVWADVIGLDYRQQTVREGMIEAMSYWVKATDIDGFRCDVAWTLPVEFWDEARARLDSIKPMFMLAEADTPEMQMRAFDMTYDWALYHLLIKVAQGQADARDLARLYSDPVRRYPAGAYRMTFTSNHDENSWNGTDKELYGDGAEAMAVLAATLPGMPLIYGGQEAGLDKRLAFFDKDSIHWKANTRAKLYATLLQMKHRHPALASGMHAGNLSLIETGNPKVFAFERKTGVDRLRVAVNLSASPIELRWRDSKTLKLKGWGWKIE